MPSPFPGMNPCLEDGFSRSGAVSSNVSYRLPPTCSVSRCCPVIS